MADIIERIIFDDSKALPALNNITQAIKETDKAMESLNAETKKVSESIGKDVINTNKEIADSTKKTAEVEKKALKEKIDATEVYGVSLGRIKGALNEYKNNLMNTIKVMGSYIALSKTQNEGVETLNNLFGGGGKAIRAFALGFNVLKVAIAATGIGALVLALGGLISFITSTQKGMDLLSSKTAYLGGAFDVVKGKASEVGNAIVTSFSNGTVIEDFTKLVKDQVINRFEALPKLFGAIGSSIKAAFDLDPEKAKEALKEATLAVGQFVTGVKGEDIKEFLTDVNQVGKAAESIQKALTALKREQAAFNVQFASSRAEVERLKKVGDDTTQTFNKRIEAVKKGAELESFINSKNLGFLNREIDLTEQRINLKGKENITDADRQTLYDLMQKKAEALNDSLGKQTEVQNNINSLIKEFNDGIKTSQDALFEVAKTFGLISSEEELNFVTDKQLGALGQMKKLFEEGTKAFQENLGYGQDFTKEIVILDKAMIAVQVQARKIKEVGLLPNAEINANTTSKLKAQLKELVDYAEKTGIDTTTAQKKIQDQLIQIAKNPLKSLTSQIPIIEFGVQIKPQPIDKGSFLDGIETAEDLYNLALNKIFGDSDEKVKGLLSGLGEFVNVFGGILNEATDIQLGNLDKQLEKLSDRRAKLEEDLTNEQELYEQGLANNLGTKKQEVDLLIAEEERLNAEREKLQKEAQRRQIIAESAQQAQALITSSIQIIKGFAPLGPIGLGLGIAAVASLFGFFAKTKVEALKATKLHGGADSIQDYFGVPNKFGRSDIGNQKGYRLIDEDNGTPTNVIISAREMLIPEKVLATQRVFFDNLKAGLYDGYDLSKLIASTTVNKGIGVTNINHTHINAPKEKKVVRQYVPFIGKDGKQRASLQTITEDMRDGSIIEFDY